MEELPPIDFGSAVWRLVITLLFVLINGFFVASEFALVRVRSSRIDALAAGGSSAARAMQSMLGRLDLYLSSCQFGITVASLILGWLAEPAIARLLLTVAQAFGLHVANNTVLHAIALAIALAIVTILHMTLGEQAPKIFSIHRPEYIALRCAYPLKIFTLVFKPLIWVINQISNRLLRLVGLTALGDHEPPLSAEEIRMVLVASARAGHITLRQRKFAENILGFMKLQVRHIMVPRVDAVLLLTNSSPEEKIEIIKNSRHSRLPLCDGDMDGTIGMIHTKDVFDLLADKKPLNFEEIARPPLYVPDTQSLGRLIVECQQKRTQCAIVVDDHGTAIGLTFLEDALEEIVGPIQDEFDDEKPDVTQLGPHVIEMRGDVPFPEAAELLHFDDAETDDTIGGHVVSLLGRMPQKGDELAIGAFTAKVLEVSKRRITLLRFERTNLPEKENPPTS